jgi:hypothetical protein
VRLESMEGSTIVKIVAISGLVVIEVANILTANIDSVVIGAIAGIIGGIAGYELKANIKKE